MTCRRLAAVALPLLQRGPCRGQPAFGGGQRGMSLLDLALLGAVALELAVQQRKRVADAAHALLGFAQSCTQRLCLVEVPARSLLLSAQRKPWLFRVVDFVLAAQRGEPIHLVAVGGDVGVERSDVLRQSGFGFDRLLVGTARRGVRRRQQFVAQRLDLVGHRVAPTAGHFAQRGVQCGAQVIGGMRDRVADVVRRALLYPQQAGDAPMLGRAGAATGVAEAEQFGQPVFGVGAVELLGAADQRAALAHEEALAEAVGNTACFKLELDRRRGGCVAPRTQVIDAARTVTLEEGGADGCDDCALAGFIRAGEQVETGIERVDLHRLAELPELFDADARELHRAPPLAPRRSRSRPASSTSASRAVSASPSLLP